MTRVPGGNRRAPLGWVFYAISMLGIGCSAYLYSVTRPAAGRVSWDLEMALVFFGLSGIASTFEFLSSKSSRFRIALAGRAASFLLLMPLVSGAPSIEYVLLGGFSVETSAYESYPRNLVICAGVLLAALAIRFWVFLAAMHGAALLALLGQADYLLVGCGFILPAALLTKYREDVITAVGDKRRLEETVVEMAKANLRYQSSAAEASETGMKDERLRITRDIH